MNEENFNENQLIIHTGNEDVNDPGFDLALMSSCDHLILSYGTFGMMAAWFKREGDLNFM